MAPALHRNARGLAGAEVGALSGKALEWAMLQNAPGRSKVTLLALAWFHNFKTGRCDPGKDSVWRLTGIASDRTVDAHIKSLADAGLITIIEGGGRENTNSYTLEIGCTHCLKQNSPLCKNCIVKGATTAGFNNEKGATIAGFSEINPATIAPKPRNYCAETPQPLPPNKEGTRKEQGTGHFGPFWSIYPRKVKKKQSLEIWKRNKLDKLADQIIADVSKRILEDRAWLDGYIPHPTTYLNGERWNDEIEQQKPEQQTRNSDEQYEILN